MNAKKAGDHLVTVCSECLKATCWHGSFMCERARFASTVERKRSTLDALGLEHPDNYSARRLTMVCGEAGRG